MGCGCQPGTGDTWDSYLQCGAVTPQPLATDDVLQQYAAQAGGQSSNFTLCYAMAVLKSRRSIYWKSQPGDCGNNGIALNQTTIDEIKVGSALGAAAGADPEPISQGILTGVAALFSGFTGAHAKAVATEQTTNCSVTTTFNSAIQQLEQAVKSGALTPAQAQTILQQVQAQADSVLAAISKPVNFSYGARLALRALTQFMGDIGFSVLAPQSVLQAIAPTPPVASPGAPGTYQTVTQAPGAPVISPGLYPVPAGYPTSPSSYAGASGSIATPLTGNNQGSGVTSASINLGIPNNIPVGAIVLIGGVAYLASRPGAVAGA